MHHEHMVNRKAAQSRLRTAETPPPAPIPPIHVSPALARPDQVTFMNLATLPSSIREAVHFTCMTHVCNAILEHITGPDVRFSLSCSGLFIYRVWCLFPDSNHTKTLGSRCAGAPLLVELLHQGCPARATEHVTLFFFLSDGIV